MGKSFFRSKIIFNLGSGGFLLLLVASLIFLSPENFDHVHLRVLTHEGFQFHSWLDIGILVSQHITSLKIIFMVELAHLFQNLLGISCLVDQDFLNQFWTLLVVVNCYLNQVGIDLLVNLGLQQVLLISE